MLALLVVACGLAGLCGAFSLVAVCVASGAALVITAAVVVVAAVMRIAIVVGVAVLTVVVSAGLVLFAVADAGIGGRASLGACRRKPDRGLRVDSRDRFLCETAGILRGILRISHKKMSEKRPKTD
ncbi:MAG TPA: hypothetical protein VF331_20025, partial [Polyangiales bacterium]